MLLCGAAIAALSNPGIEVHPADACPAAGVQPPAFCSLPEAIAWAAAQASDGGQGGGDEQQQQRRLCLHSGIHRLREPLLLTGAHSHMHWSVCEGGGGGGAGATISGGFSVPAAQAYGSKGAGDGDVVPPYADLIFDIELLAVRQRVPT